MISGGIEITPRSDVGMQVLERTRRLVRLSCERGWRIRKRKIDKKLCANTESNKLYKYLSRIGWYKLNKDFRSSFVRSMSSSMRIQREVIGSRMKGTIPSLMFGKPIWEQVFTKQRKYWARQPDIEIKGSTGEEQAGGTKEENPTGGVMKSGGQQLTLTPEQSEAARRAARKMVGYLCNRKQYKTSGVPDNNKDCRSPSLRTGEAKDEFLKGVKYDDLSNEARSRFMRYLGSERSLQSIVGKRIGEKIAGKVYSALGYGAKEEAPEKPVFKAAPPTATVEKPRPEPREEPPVKSRREEEPEKPEKTDKSKKAEEKEEPKKKERKTGRLVIHAGVGMGLQGGKIETTVPDENTKPNKFQVWSFDGAVDAAFRVASRLYIGGRLGLGYSKFSKFENVPATNETSPGGSFFYGHIGPLVMGKLFKGLWAHGALMFGGYRASKMNMGVLGMGRSFSAPHLAFEAGVRYIFGRFFWVGLKFQAQYGLSEAFEMRMDSTLPFDVSGFPKLSLAKGILELGFSIDLF